MKSTMDYKIDIRIGNRLELSVQSNKNLTIDYKIDFQRSTIAYKIGIGIKNRCNRLKLNFVAFRVP